MSLRAATRPRHNEHGSALLMAIVITIVLSLSGVSLLYYAGSLTQTHRNLTDKEGALLCADAGLQRGRTYFANKYLTWDTLLTAPLTDSSRILLGDADGDGSNDYKVTIRDNVDEFGTNDPQRDNDLRIVVHSECISSTMDPKGTGRVIEGIIRYVAPESDNAMEGEGPSHSGNANP